MSDDSKAIAIFTAHLGSKNGIKPLTPTQWNAVCKILNEKSIRPNDLLTMSDSEIDKLFSSTKLNLENLKTLRDRGGSFAFELERLFSKGVKIVTRADEDYPARLKKILGYKCPPLFCYVGDLSLANNKYIGFVGSRSINDNDEMFTDAIVRKCLQNGYSIVSGGARGVDTISVNSCLKNNGKAIMYVADSLLKKIRNGQVIENIKNKKLLVLSAASPSAGFNVGNAMQRNKFIYGQSEATVVVKSDLGKGGTWTGANENLKNNWVPLFCQDNKRYKGNQELIRAGAIPINQSWDGQLLDNRRLSNDKAEGKKHATRKKPVQITIFD